MLIVEARAVIDLVTPPKKTASRGGRHSWVWWRWRESNSRPEALYSRAYMLRQSLISHPDTVDGHTMAGPVTYF